MNRLWVRFSLIISGFMLLLIVIPGGTILLLEELNITNISDDDQQVEEDGFKLRDLPETVAGITLVVAIIGSGLGVWLSRGLVAPIVELAAGAQRIGEGELAYRVPEKATSQELMELARSFNKMADDLQHAETLRSNLLADVSHELRTPLTTLSGRLRAGLDNVIELDEEAMAMLYGQTQHLIHLVEDLQLLAQAESGQLPMEMVSIDVAQFWAEIDANFQLMAQEKGVAVVHKPAGTPITLHGDPQRLRQVASNLLANALRHTPAGGVITTQIRHLPNAITITIQDNGDGIEPAHLPHLFDRFYRVDASRSRESGGSGLGLAIAKAIIESHGGNLSAHSVGNGKGSTFTMRLPFIS